MLNQHPEAQVVQNRVSWAPHGRTLASASDDRTVRVWALPDEAPNAYEKPVTLVAMRILYGHEARVWDVRFWGSLVISASEDCTCRQSLFTLLSAVMGPLHQSGFSIIDHASPGASRLCPGLTLCSLELDVRRYSKHRLLRGLQSADNADPIKM